MDLQIYDEKHIRVTDIYGETHTGAAENVGSRRVLEKSGMKLVRAALDDLVVGEKRYERLFFEYKFEFITET